MKTFKQKGFFWWKELSIRFVALYMLKTKDFSLELTSKYKKTYNWRYWRNYNDVLNWNINNSEYQNLQLYFHGSEGGKFRNQSLIKEFLLLW